MSDRAPPDAALLHTRPPRPLVGPVGARALARVASRYAAGASCRYHPQRQHASPRGGPVARLRVSHTPAARAAPSINHLLAQPFVRAGGEYGYTSLPKKVGGGQGRPAGRGGTAGSWTVAPDGNGGDSVFEWTTLPTTARLDAWFRALMSLDSAVGPYDASACRYAHVNLRLASACVLQDPDAC